ncbi:EAL domain-containing protein [Pacificimonas sp. ICDLI1SI03]
MGQITTEDEFRVSFEMAPFPAMHLDCDLTVLACNAAYEQVAHVKRAAMVGQRIFELFPGSDNLQTKTLRDSFDWVRTTRKAHHIPHMQYATTVPDHPGLQERHWTVSNVPLLRSDGALLGILHCPEDITELTYLRRANQSIQDAMPYPRTRGDIQRWTRSVQNILVSEKERLHRLFQQAPGFICVLRGPQHVFELANDAYYQLVGHRRVIGRRLVDVMPEIVEQGFLDKLDSAYSSGVPFIGRAMPIELQRMSGGDLEQRHIDLIYQPTHDANNKVSGIFVQGNDVTEAHILSQKVIYQAAHDPLTGLYNRREFARLTQQIDEPGTHALFCMDVDHLKIVNDRCGHAAGDKLLMEVSETLKSHCNSGDDLLARLGGDEFALVRRNCSSKDATVLATRLCAAIRDIRFVWRGKRYGVTLSIGVANFEGQDGMSFESALGLADAACFLAKEKGRNRVQISSASDEEVRQQQRDMDNVTRLKEGMREDRVSLYAQKMFALQSAEEEGPVFYEVLARLRDPSGEIIMPAGFIPAAERYGLIEELDRHIICKAFAYLQVQPQEQRHSTCYFINISAMTLSTQGFQDFVEDSLAAYPLISPSQICFEVTETAAIYNIERTAEAMQRLVDIGFRFALDDFGSGMASFSYLSRLPVQFVKIDGEFVNATVDQPAGKIIVEAVAKVARSMNMRTIAESVELDELIPHLRSLGLDYAQGFALHCPQPIGEC